MRPRSSLRTAWIAAGLLTLFSGISRSDDRPEIPNPAIDMDSHLRLSAEAARLRETHRLSEEEFLRMSREPDTVVLDARSTEKYAELHVRGAVHLSFSDITADSLRRVIPSRDTRVLIYCNNNFSNAESAFALKAPPASLNLSTYVTLYIYGYRNVYELGPRVDLKASRLEFESAR
jgi:phage shock protein E